MNKSTVSYPSNVLHKSGNYISMFNTDILPYNNCRNTLCYTQSKGMFIYKPHTAYGMVGTSSASYLARRKRL